MRKTTLWKLVISVFALSLLMQNAAQADHPCSGLKLREQHLRNALQILAAKINNEKFELRGAEIAADNICASYGENSGICKRARARVISLKNLIAANERHQTAFEYSLAQTCTEERENNCPDPC